MAAEAAPLRKRGFSAACEGQGSDLPAPKRVEQAPVAWSPAFAQQPLQHPAALQLTPQPDISSSRKRGLAAAYDDSELPAQTPKRVEQAPSAWPASAQPLRQPTPFPFAAQPHVPGALDGHTQQQQQQQKSFALISTPPHAPPTVLPAAAPPAAIPNSSLDVSSPFTDPASSCRDVVLAKACHPDFCLPQLLHTLSPAVKRHPDGNFTIDANMLQRIGRRLTPEQQASLAGLWQFVVANYRHSFALGPQGVDGVVSKEPIVTIEEEDEQQERGVQNGRGMQQPQWQQAMQQEAQQWQQAMQHQAQQGQQGQNQQQWQQQRQAELGQQQWQPLQQHPHHQQQQQQQGAAVMDVTDGAAAGPMPMEGVHDTAAPMEE